MSRIWVECLMRDKGALNEFMEFLESKEAEMAKEAVEYFDMGDDVSSHTASAKSLAWKSIRERVSMYIREEEQNAIIQK